MSQPRNPLFYIRLVLWGLVLVAGLGASWIFLGSTTRTIPASETITSREVTDTIGQGDYALTTTSGAAFTSASLVGQPSFVFFGFTHCPDVCPTTMGEIMAWKDALGPQADAVKTWFITVDPERDSLDILREYISWMPGAEGVTGAPEQIEAALKAFKIYARKVPSEGADYGVDHSAYVLVFDAQGRYNQIFSYQEPQEQVVAKLERFLNEQGS